LHSGFEIHRTTDSMPVHTLGAYLIEPYNIGFHNSTFGDYILYNTGQHKFLPGIILIYF
jgi:hypothetical protein